MASNPVDDFTFLMTCLVHSTGDFPKPDFEKVAAQIGAKSAGACYHRLWSMKRKWGVSGGPRNDAAAGKKAKGGAAAPKTVASGGVKAGAKRGRPTKAKTTPAADVGRKAAAAAANHDDGRCSDGDDDGDDDGDKPAKKPRKEVDEHKCSQNGKPEQREIISVEDSADEDA